MPSPDEMKATFKRYIERLTASDVDGIMALYAEDGEIEDPVGAPPKRGHADLRAFYTVMAPALQVEIVGPICVAGGHAAAPLRACVTLGAGKRRYLDAVDVLRFDDDGLIASVRAYWNPAEMRDTPAL